MDTKEVTILEEIHPDMVRFLENDCYCPHEIYDITGFFYMLFYPKSPCYIINQNNDKTAVVAWHSAQERDGAKDDMSNPQAIIFWHDEKSKPGRIIDAQRVDATDNNIKILHDIVDGKKPDGRKIDEFNEGSTKAAVDKIIQLADAIIID